MNPGIQGEQINKAITDIEQHLNGFTYREALEILERVAYRIKDHATVNASSKSD